MSGHAQRINLKDELAILALTIQFLTRVPLVPSGVFTPERMAATPRYYPLVGAFIGGVQALFLLLANLIWPLSVSVLLAMMVGLVITGAFHEDGLADTFDGIGGGATRDQALAIMRDSRLGTYGTLALVALWGLKAATLILLDERPIILFALVLGHGLSRLSSLLVIASSRYVRDEGTGKPVARNLSAASLAVGILTGTIMVAIGFALLPSAMIGTAMVGLILGHAMMRAAFERKLGGYTGDTLGAVQQVSEVGIYLGLLAWA